MAKKRMARGVQYNSWCAHLIQALEDLGGEANVGEIREHLAQSDDPFVKEKVQNVRTWESVANLVLTTNTDGKGHDVFQRVGIGRYRLKGASPEWKEVRDKIQSMLRMRQAGKGLTPESVEVESHFEEGRESTDVRFVFKVKKG